MQCCLQTQKFNIYQKWIQCQALVSSPKCSCLSPSTVGLFSLPWDLVWEVRSLQLRTCGHVQAEWGTRFATSGKKGTWLITAQIRGGWNLAASGGCRRWARWQIVLSGVCRSCLRLWESSLTEQQQEVWACDRVHSRKPALTEGACLPPS